MLICAVNTKKEGRAGENGDCGTGMTYTGNIFPSLWTPTQAKKRSLSVLQGLDPELSQEITKRSYRPNHAHGGNIGSSDYTVETLTEGQSTRSSVDKFTLSFFPMPGI